RKILHAGADKISVNTPALQNPDLIDALVDAFGSQCVVIGIDSHCDDRGYHVKQFTGDPDRTEDARRKTLDWVSEVQARGAGEIVLNCMNEDGVGSGYDVGQLRAVREICSVPLIASGGAGREAHFRDVFQQADVDGALAATVFHSGKIPIPRLKQYLIEEGVAVRT
ncbi:MAG: HisA/HisF-related TIM barrel protein, partial [Xanthomonadales bacterium]|nr:HisA/HisF-related TIM barrel protein [Xanthomonadales bacterium]